MFDPTQEQIRNAVSALNKVLNPLGVEAAYSDAWDGIEDGIRFRDQKSGELLLAKDLIDIIEEKIGFLGERMLEGKGENLNISRLSRIVDHITEGDTGITAALVPSYAVISDDVLQEDLLGEVFTEINQEQSLLSGEGHEWGGVVAIDDAFFSTKQQIQMAQTLNWLEKHDPEFKESLWHIKQAQERGEIREPVSIMYRHGSIDSGGHFDEMSMSFDDPLGYVGKDGKIYQTSLNELLAHEVKHFAQKNYSDYRQNKADESAAEEYMRSQSGKLEEYLAQKYGLENRFQQEPYFKYIEGSKVSDIDTKGLDQKIISDPHYRSLAQNLLKAEIAYHDYRLRYEDDAMDGVTGLRASLGKSPRVHYLDNQVFSDQIKTALEGREMLVYTDSPDKIKAQGHRSWDVEGKGVFPPLLTGKLGVQYGTVRDLQSGWDQKWNQDSKNINADEWGVIVDVKRQMLSQNLDDITGAEQDRNTLLVNKLMREFNKSSGFDGVSSDLQQDLRVEGVQLRIQNSF